MVQMLSNVATRRGKGRRVLYVLLAGGSLAFGAAPKSTGDATPAGSRVLHFPSDKGLGWVKVCPQGFNASPEDGMYHWGDDAGWETIAPARGDVTIPPGQRVRLLLNGPSLAALSSLGPDDVYALSFWRGGESAMPRIAHLTGLRRLVFPRLFEPGTHSCRFSPKSLKLLARCKSLEEIEAPENIGDEGMAAIVEACPRLRKLFFYRHSLTDAGAASVARLRLLEELTFGSSGNLTAAGLAPLIQLPHLRYLELWGQFDDAVMPHLRRMESLDTLKLPYQKITDDGLKQLAGHPRLRVLGLFNTKVSSRGLVHLKDLPALRGVRLGKWGGRMENLDEGVLDLAALIRLESLELPEGITDVGMARLAAMTQLRHLRIGNSSESPLTDRSLESVAKLKNLEYLSISGKGFTDDGMANLTALKHLKYFGMPACQKVTDAGFAHLTVLNDIEQVFLPVHSRMTLASVRMLNQFPKLRCIDAGWIRTRSDDVPLDFSNLHNLEDVMLAAYLRDDEVATFRNMPRLRRLQLGHCPELTDAGLAHIAENLPTLPMFSVYRTQCTDAGLASLARMRLLSSLRIEGRFTDKGLALMESMKDLQTLELTPYEPFSDAALRHFAKAAPHVRLTQQTKQQPAQGATQAEKK